MKSIIKKTPRISKPLLSIGLTTYNRPDFLKQSVNSILNQSFQNFELLISNDYQDAIVSFRSLGIPFDPRIKIINQRFNLGEYGNLNFLLKISSGHWFIWMGDDDLFDPNFLSFVFREIRTNKKSIGFFSNYIAANDPSEIFPKKYNLIRFNSYNAKNFLSGYTSKKIPLIGIYGVIKTSALKKIGGMKTLGNSFSPYGDTLIPILLCEYGLISWTSEPLVFLRTHADSMSCKSLDFVAYTSAERDFINALVRVCSSVGLADYSRHYILNMIYWFMVDEWAVLNRNPSLNFYSICKIFTAHQIKVNFFRLKYIQRLWFSFFLFIFFSKCIVKRIGKFFFSAKRFF